MEFKNGQGPSETGRPAPRPQRRTGPSGNNLLPIPSPLDHPGGRDSGWVRREDPGSRLDAFVGGWKAMTVIKRLGCWSTWMLVLCMGSFEAADSGTEWKAGVARVDTTPTKPVRMAGYSGRTSPSQGVAHPLVAKAL